MILQHKGVPIFYTQTGNGEAVILLHGFLENSTMWDNLVPIISKTHQTITIDLLGHGKTGCLGYIHTMEMMAEVVDVVLKHLKIDKATFIGHSMGGYVALAYADLFKEKINGLCLMNSTASDDSSEKKLNRDRAIKAVKQNHKAFISMSISNLFAPNNRELFLEDIDCVKQEALKTPLQGIVAAIEGMKTRKNREQSFKNATFKKMMIIGRQDPVLEYDNLIKQTKGSNVKIVEFNDGHMSHIENKEEFTYNIMYFIE